MPSLFEICQMVLEKKTLKFNVVNVYTYGFSLGFPFGSGHGSLFEQFESLFLQKYFVSS